MYCDLLINHKYLFLNCFTNYILSQWSVLFSFVSLGNSAVASLTTFWRLLIDWSVSCINLFSNCMLCMDLPIALSIFSWNCLHYIFNWCVKNKHTSILPLGIPVSTNSSHCPLIVASNGASLTPTAMVELTGSTDGFSTEDCSNCSELANNLLKLVTTWSKIVFLVGLKVYIGVCY